MRPRWDEMAALRWTLILLLALLTVAIAIEAHADGSLSDPTLLILLPDGTVIPACGFEMVVQDAGPRAAVVEPCIPLFRDGFE